MDADKLKASAGWGSGLRNRSCHVGCLVGELIQLRSQGQAGVDRPDITEHTWDSEGPRDRECSDEAKWLCFQLSWEEGRYVEDMPWNGTPDSACSHWAACHHDWSGSHVVNTPLLKGISE